MGHYDLDHSTPPAALLRMGEVTNMGEKEISTIETRVDALTGTVGDCAALLGIDVAVREEQKGGTLIDRLLEKFDTLDSLGTAVRDELHKL